ncbi:MAG: DUF2884 family protein [Kangiellaceae bacterium]
MKSLKLTSLLVASIISTGVLAGNNSSSKNQCDYSVDYDVKLDEKKITLTHPDKKEITFLSDELIIDGKSVDLTPSQLDASQKFQTKARKLVPEIADIAIEGAELGVKAATMVITALGGATSEEQKELIEPLNKISQKIRDNIDHKTFNSKSLSTDFDKEIEQEIEAFVGKAISQFSGKMVSQVMSSIFSGDDAKSEEMKDFEFRMENLEHDIETYVEANAKELEEKADALCVDLKEMEKLDLVLESVQGYPEKGVIQPGDGHSFHINRISLNND